MADGLTDKSIQAKLGMSDGTLRTQMGRIAERLKLDHAKNLRVQITWLVVDNRYDRDPDYQCPLPCKPKETA